MSAVQRANPYAKAIIGALIAGLTTLGAVLADGTVHPAEWTAVAVSALTTLVGVHQVPNRPKPK